jgi:cystathionine beta-lyase/cystathionine gamma-synthase
MPGFSTRAIKAASRVPDAPQPPVNVPIYATSTFEVSDAAELAELLEFARPGHSYTRYSNPTHDALERALAELEGAEAALVTASGMAAIHAVILSVLRSGDEVVIPSAVYGGTIGLARSVLERSGILHRTVDTTDHAAVEAALDGGAKLLWLETISNPTTAMADVAVLAELAHARGVLVGVDNTFASPALANPLALGADVVVHSTTKYIGGHSDLMGGAMVGPMERVDAARHMRMERHSSNALAVARALEGAAGVAGVRYPGLPSHAQHELACRVLRGGMAGGMLALELAGGREHGERFLQRVRVAVHATSLGSVETLVSHPASSSHRQLTDPDLAGAGLTPGTVRVSIGLEDAEDLVADLVAAVDPS